jgi:2,4-dienoyl-CoA reductase (NADPH2)
MSSHEPFKFKDESDLLQKAKDLDITLPFQESLDPLFEACRIGEQKTSNRFAIQPMEGFDADNDGSPSDLTFRRYGRYAQGGSTLIWFEATSVTSEGRSNPHQLWIHSKSLDPFKRLVEETRQTARKSYGQGHDLFLVLQLTHSGRYAKPRGKPEPQIVCSNPHLSPSGDDTDLVSDDDLRYLRDTFIEAIQLAHEAGFDAVDIKACHGYLLHELLGARGRTNSSYGGPFENRIRLISEIAERGRHRQPAIQTALRLSATDGIPYPYGFGVADGEKSSINLTEPTTLIGHLIEKGCSLFNITIGNPHHKSHFSRPFDRALPGSDLPDEHPLEGVERLLKVTAELQRQFPDIPFVSTGYSWLRQFLPHVGSAAIHQGMAAFMGLGRCAFAYPDAPRDLMENGSMDRKKVCITCSGCTQRMREGQPTGCTVRDSALYSKDRTDLQDMIP